MDQYPAHECHAAGGLQQALAPWAWLCVGVYGLGLPLIFLGVVLKPENRAIIYRDQEHVRLRLKQKRHEQRDDEYEFHNRYSEIYKRYEPEYAWWSATVLARKFAVSVVTIMFNADPMFQASLGLVVLFVSFAAHMYTQPYLRSPEAVQKSVDRALKKIEAIRAKERLVAQQARAAAASGGPGAAVEDDGDDDDEGDGRRSSVPTLERSASSLRRLMAGARRAKETSRRYLFDYNRIEMTLLFCSIVVLLSGIMFRTGLYRKGSDEHTSLKWIVVGVIAACTALFAFVFFSEMVRADCCVCLMCCADARARDNPSGSSARRRGRRRAATTRRKKRAASR